MRTFSAQKAGLTRAVKSGLPERVIAECRKTVNEWEGLDHGWPDDWSRWQRALDDTLGWKSMDLEDLIER